MTTVENGKTERCKCTNCTCRPCTCGTRRQDCAPSCDCRNEAR